MNLGKKIKAARKRIQPKLTLTELSKRLGLGVSTLSGYETNQPKQGIDPNTLIKIADALNDLSILAEHCLICPVRQTLFIRQFPDLNNIWRDPAIITSRLRKEMIEAAEALEELAELFSDKDFRLRPDFLTIFSAKMEQVIDAERGIEILKHELVLEGHVSGKDMQHVYGCQQKKCEARGHHRPEPEELS
jgi:transcriptional regulator with XRE-family HTH domain